MELTRRYRKTNRHLFRFVVVESPGVMGYNVRIYKWNFIEKKHEIFSLLSESSYDEMLSEPDLLFESILNEEDKPRNSIFNLIEECKVLFRLDFTHDVARNDLSIGFPVREGANKVIAKLENLFRDFRI